jgi:hypothetical protein
VGAALVLSRSLDRAGRFEGERLREEERRGEELDRGGVACCAAFCLACSSAMRALMAPPMRWSFRQHCAERMHVKTLPGAGSQTSTKTCWATAVQREE